MVSTVFNEAQMAQATRGELKQVAASEDIVEGWWHTNVHIRATSITDVSHLCLPKTKQLCLLRTAESVHIMRSALGSHTLTDVMEQRGQTYLELRSGLLLEERILLYQLQTRGITVGGIAQQPWAYECGFMTDMLEKCRYPGIAIEYLRRLCRRSGIPCRFKMINESAVTPQLYEHSGDYAELMRLQLVIEEEYETVLPLMVETTSLRSDLEFTTPIFFVQDGLLVKPSYSVTEFLAQPFQTEVWAVLFATLFTTIILDLIFRYVIHLAHRSRYKAQVDHSVLHRIKPSSEWVNSSNASWLNNFGIFLQRSVNISVTEWSRRMLYAVLGLSTLIICAMYSAFLVSHRVAVKTSLPFESLEELTEAIESRQYKLLIDAHSTTFINSIRTMRDLGRGDEILQRLTAAFEQNEPELVLNMTSAVARVANQSEFDNPKLVLYSSYASLTAHTQTDCSVRIVPLSVTNRGTFAFKKQPNSGGLPMRSLFNKLALTFREFGDFLEQQEMKYRFGRNCHARRADDKHGINLQNVKGAIEILTSGFLLAFAVVISERLYRLQIMPCCLQRRLEVTLKVETSDGTFAIFRFPFRMVLGRLFSHP